MNSTAARSLIVVSFICAGTPAGAQWNWESPSPQGNTLWKTQFLDSQHGWAVGDYGTILSTEDGAASWTEQEYGRTDNILDLSMVSLTEGWAAGDNGVILHTVNAGDDWTEQNSGVTSGLNAVHFVDQQLGWAVGDGEVILHTTNGGSSWTLQLQGTPMISINDVRFLSASAGWAVGSNRRVYHTTDGGTIWSAQTVGFTSASYLGVHFADASLGFIVGTGGVILRTDNGGASWSPVSSGVPQNLNDIVMQNSFVGWIGGDAGAYLKTVNGGQSWSSTVVGGGDNLNGLSRVGADVWMAGELGAIMKSTNSGVSWAELDAGSRLSANWVDYATKTTGTAAGQTGLLLRTTDGGRTWAELASPLPAVSCYGAAMTDPLHAWAVGDNGTILRTMDGTTWEAQSSPVSHALFGVTFSDPSHGWITGGEFAGFTGVILQSTDAGASWTVQQSSVSSILYGIAFPAPSSGWAVGDNGLILHTTDGGGSWTVQPTGVTTSLFWCAFDGASSGWSVGEGGTVLRTTDGGSTWSTQTSGVPYNLYAIAVSGPLDATITGDEGTILHTSDGGANWELQYARTANSIFGIADAGSAGLVACGDYGTILKLGPELPVTGAAGGRVFNDLNGDSAAENGEPGMPGWSVHLSGAAEDSVLTVADGSFLFTGVPFGAYTLSCLPRPGWSRTMPADPPAYAFSLSVDTAEFSGDFGEFVSEAYAFPLDARWNLASLPLVAGDPRAAEIYPNAVSDVFAFDQGYLQRDTIFRGEGYWIKSPFAQSVWVPGSSILDDTIAVGAGWNIIGSINETVPVSSVTTDPPGIIASSFFSYHGGYTAVLNLSPGMGAWVNVKKAGRIILHGSGQAPARLGPDATGRLR